MDLGFGVFETVGDPGRGNGMYAARPWKKIFDSKCEIPHINYAIPTLRIDSERDVALRTNLILAREA
jgi:hypothetical protein